MRNVKLAVTIILVGFVVLFAVQNAEVLQVNILLWTIEARRVVILFGVLGIGVLIGWIAHSLGRKDDVTRPLARTLVTRTIG